jgi:signal transduction histidine kinase
LSDSLLTAYFTRRAPFWRALLELTLLSLLLFALPYAFANRIASPWRELLGYLGMGLYIYAAWRLEPGRGGLVRRVARVLGWMALLGMINSVVGWLCITYLPNDTRWLGMRLSELELSPSTYLLSSMLLISSLFLPTRVLLAAWGLGTRQLRWRLTFSYMLTGLLTLVFVPLALLIYVAVLSLSAAPTIVLPSQVAPTLAAALEPALRATPPDKLGPFLAGLLAGTTRLPLPAGEHASETASGALLAGVRRLTLVGPDGQVLASAGREPFAAGVQLMADAELGLLLPRAVAGGACVEGYPAEGAIADTAACPLGAGPDALLLVESAIDSSAQISAAFSRIVAITLFGTSFVLNLTALVVLALVPLALGVGYLIASGLTRRIEGLDRATASLAAGNLGSRADAAAPDEIGRLGATFNTMAAQLQERERALAAAAERAEALLRANKRLVADVSHELRNPLATLWGYLEALEQEHGGRLPPDDMRVIRGEMERLTALVDDLFTLVRVEAQQLSLSPGPVDAGALVGRLVETLAPLARRELEIELLAQVRPGTPLAYADAARLEQALRNLAQNALRHTPPGGIIALEVAPGPAETVTIAVADTGLGIEPEDLPHVFERFYRGDSSRARETGGAGLGLALVRELVTAMGGSVEAESVAGRGARFTLTLRQA